jgi:hypothetical protein
VEIVVLIMPAQQFCRGIRSPSNVTSLVSIHSIFPIPAIALIWLPITKQSKSISTAPETELIYGNLWTPIHMLGHSMEVYIDITLIYLDL